MPNTEVIYYVFHAGKELIFPIEEHSADDAIYPAAEVTVAAFGTREEAEQYVIDNGLLMPSEDTNL